MLRIKRHFPFNKRIVVGSAAFVVGFVGSIAALGATFPSSTQDFSANFNTPSQQRDTGSSTSETLPVTTANDSSDADSTDSDTTSSSWVPVWTSPTRPAPTPASAQTSSPASNPQAPTSTPVTQAPATPSTPLSSSDQPPANDGNGSINLPGTPVTPPIQISLP